MTTTKKTEPTAAEEAAIADRLLKRLDRLGDEISLTVAAGPIDQAKLTALLDEKNAVLKEYQAARIAADRPRVG